MKECAVNVQPCMHGRGRKFSILYNFIIYITPYSAPLIHIVHISMYICSNGTHTESHHMLRMYIYAFGTHMIPYNIPECIYATGIGM